MSQLVRNATPAARAAAMATKTTRKGRRIFTQTLVKIDKYEVYASLVQPASGFATLACYEAVVQEERRGTSKLPTIGSRTAISRLQVLKAMSLSFSPDMPQPAAVAPLAVSQRSIVMVGLMGAGKSAIGKRLATRLGLAFVDTDREVETAAGCSIAEIFELYGEPAFRDVERRVILRLLEGARGVMATGGGAFVDPHTRAAIKQRGVSVWLQADLDTLVRRTAKRTHRPLLNSGDPREILATLMAAREPLYAQADLSVQSSEASPDETTQRVADALAEFCANAGAP
jgi:shikimate kinase